MNIHTGSAIGRPHKRLLNTRDCQQQIKNGYRLFKPFHEDYIWRTEVADNLYLVNFERMFPWYFYIMTNILSLMKMRTLFLYKIEEESGYKYESITYFNVDSSIRYYYLAHKITGLEILPTSDPNFTYCHKTWEETDNSSSTPIFDSLPLYEGLKIVRDAPDPHSTSLSLSYDNSYLSRVVCRMPNLEEVLKRKVITNDVINNAFSRQPLFNALYIINLYITNDREVYYKRPKVSSVYQIDLRINPPDLMSASPINIKEPSEIDQAIRDDNVIIYTEDEIPDGYPIRKKRVISLNMELSDLLDYMERQYANQ